MLHELGSVDRQPPLFDGEGLRERRIEVDQAVQLFEGERLS